MAGHFLFPSFSIYLCLFVSQAAGSPLRFTVKPLMNSPLKFKQQHHLWIANCALMGEPVQTLCDQSSHRHIVTSSTIYGKAGRTLLFGAYFLESKKHQKGSVYSTDHIS